jgi:UDPglucose 6-dehydrogenase
VYFVAVPTPMLPDGSADTSIVESVLDDLASQPRSKKSCRIAVIKSTCPPGTTERWNKKYASTPLRVIFNPEFLTEANAVEDFKNQDRIVLGGPRPYINMVKQVFEAAFPRVPIVKTSSTTAEMVKYTTNATLAVKVSLANEFSQICEALDARGLDIDYDKVMEYASLDKRLGTSHWKVPGPDGHRGFGGSCFPKDVNALMHIARQHGIEPMTLDGAWRKNLDVRPERDWERLKGRAVA